MSLLIRNSNLCVVEALAFYFFCYLVTVKGLVIDDFGAKVPRLLNFLQKLILTPHLQINEFILILVTVKGATEMDLVLLLLLVLILLIIA